jgi:diguanylate cyclase (GGDEF)-like protein
VLQYLETATAELDAFNIIERDTGAYTRSYLLHRIWGEVSRARRSKRPLSLGLVRMEVETESDANHGRVHAEVMRLTKTTIERTLREGDLLARFDRSTFAVLLPDTSEQQAQNLLKKTISRVRVMPDYVNSQKHGPDVRAVLGVATYSDFRLEPERFLEDALRALDATEIGLPPAERVNGKGHNGVVKDSEPENDEDFIGIIESDLVED